MKQIKGIKKEMGSFFDTAGNVVSCTTVSVSVWPEFEIVEGTKVKIVGKSKGRGFTGVMKRYGHKGGPATHGQSDRQRAIGSTGPSTPGRVFKGLKMPGRFGGTQVTVLGSKIVAMDKEAGIVKVLGGIPGAFNSKVLLKIYES
ncbi:50S ribosomal protein L3 [candidate division WWE3 bacterium CG08_land_8_20_14_0_20_40_13]|uniref:Large ribosomal subunit protein uL3 n=1 Tax=candidate division WWE3 bacterium CG08_land_8_20_14_0_20_40_13 TaxID=1975084 RepID=A0A2H0XGS2_UNCKA|nr:MAG: 50S ribosomal protein L3 [candidate division WWE3 bacterium CG08_land_8_20_14_0_20_40_13]